MLGFLPSGGTWIFRGFIASAIQGIPDVVSNTKWLVDQQAFRQLEMFEYEQPEPKIHERAPNDVGYTALGLHVRDLDAMAKRLRDAGTSLLAGPVGAAGARRISIRDPEGVLLELMEDDPRADGSGVRERPEVPVAIRSITLSVPDLARSRRFFVETLGLNVETRSDLLHSEIHEELFGLEGARSERLLLWADDFLIELKQYTDPRGKPWPDGYRICDRGLLNVAFGFRDRRHFRQIFDRIIESGYTSNSRPVSLPGWDVVYVNDDSSFSVELLRVSPLADGFMGFEPEEPAGEDRG
jgi:catechol 2,3-dioxygenase-like lactoylglutathione lyase family enzyme